MSRVYRTGISAEYLRSILDYDPETGVFLWTEAGNASGRKRMGVPVGTVGHYGYVVIRIAEGEVYPAHRLAWLHYYGKWPDEQLDHISCDRADNRIANLREATGFENARNQPIRVTNKSGFKGVSRHSETGNWVAQITFNRKSMYLGLFKTPEQAHQVYAAAAKRLHRDFARLV